MLDGFIKKFVLCPECENPETDLVSAFAVLVNRRKTVFISVMLPNHVPKEAEQTYVNCKPQILQAFPY